MLGATAEERMRNEHVRQQPQADNIIGKKRNKENCRNNYGHREASIGRVDNQLYSIRNVCGVRLNKTAVGVPCFMRVHIPEKRFSRGTHDVSLYRNWSTLRENGRCELSFFLALPVTSLLFVYRHSLESPYEV